MQARADLFPGSANERQSLALPIAVSMICHLILFGFIVSSPVHLSARRMAPTIVNVSLVDLPRIQTAPARKPPSSKSTAKTAAKPAEKPAVKEKAQVPKAPAPATKSVPKPKPADTVSTAPPKWSEKVSLKEETFKPKQVLKQAIKKIEEKAESSRPSSVAAAIERIRGKVKEEAEKEPADNAPAAEDAPADTEPAGTEPAGGQTAAEKLVYQQEIIYHIRNNWVYPEQLAGQQKDLEARLRIKIMADGEIDDVRFEKRSGSRYLDESAYKAVLKSNPLPPLPSGYRSYTVILGFTPEGLQ